MLALMVVFWTLIFLTSYVAIEFILFKGRQHNRFFATFINTILPVVGSVPAYIMACKYEKRIHDSTRKIKNMIVKYVIIGMQIASVLLLLAPFYKTNSGYISGFGLIFGSGAGDEAFKPMIFLVYLIVFPVVSALLNFFMSKINVSNFITYSVSLLNALTVLMYDFIFSSDEMTATAFIWIYAIFNIMIMLASFVSMIVTRDLFLFRLEYSEKIEYIKEQKLKAKKNLENKPDDNMYKCSKCGNLVEKGTICKCITAVKKEELSETVSDDGISPSSYCIYCKKPLGEGESCDCQGEGFGITIKNEPSKNRKCMYCGQVLVGESTCVCEKIMKKSAPVQNETKKFFESQVEMGNNFVADELADLEKKINSRFEHVIESIEATENDDAAQFVESLELNE